jgi:hypothetical protein
MKRLLGTDKEKKRMTSLLVRKQQALEQMHRFRELSEVAELEQSQMQHIIDSALAHEDASEHWQAYEDLKAVASGIVGWDARYPQLKTCAHYEIMVEFIDWLLTLAETREEIAE